MINAAEKLSEWATKGAAMGADCGKMCSSCAFKKGSVTQTEEHNTGKALECLAYFGQFNCHVNDYEDAGKPCAGFLYAKKYLESKEHDKCQ